MARNFIIIDPDPIVSLDLEGLLLSNFPQADIVSVCSPEEITKYKRVTTEETTLFVRSHMMAENDDVARLVKAAAAAGSSVVLIGSHAGADIPAQIVDLPFTNESVLQKIVSLTPKVKPGDLH